MVCMYAYGASSPCMPALSASKLCVKGVPLPDAPLMAIPNPQRACLDGTCMAAVYMQLTQTADDSCVAVLVLRQEAQVLKMATAAVIRRHGAVNARDLAVAVNVAAARRNDTSVNIKDSMDQGDWECKAIHMAKQEPFKASCCGVASRRQIRKAATDKQAENKHMRANVDIWASSVCKVRAGPHCCLRLLCTSSPL
jgi:hypothetical protein